MKRKRTRGRQKIRIQRIEKEGDCFATFSKRRVGLFKKASELCTLCNIDMGIILFSPTGKPFSFFHPTMESVINKFQNPNQQLNDSSRLLEAYTRTRILQLNQLLDDATEQLEAEIDREKHLAEKNGTSCNGGWWEGPIEEFNKDQVEQLTTWFKNLQFQVKDHEKELELLENAQQGLLDIATREANNSSHINDQVLASYVSYAHVTENREAL